MTERPTKHEAVREKEINSLKEIVMHLIEIFLPLADNDGARFPFHNYESVERELTERFGGVTAYPRAPARGLWKRSETTEQQDDFVIYEVMTDHIDRDWWQSYRTKLERIFRQDKLMVRAHAIKML
jgi:hypothetical protein